MESWWRTCFLLLCYWHLPVSRPAVGKVFLSSLPRPIHDFSAALSTGTLLPEGVNQAPTQNDKIHSWIKLSRRWTGQETPIVSRSPYTFHTSNVVKLSQQRFSQPPIKLRKSISIEAVKLTALQNTERLVCKKPILCQCPPKIRMG